MYQRIIQNWVYGGFLSGILLLVLMVEFGRHWSLALTLIFLQLPAYMLHQFEEHDNDRFRRFFNRTLGQGNEVLTPLAVFMINVPGVWGVDAVSFLLASYVNLGWGLIAVDLTLINAIVHIVMSLRQRAYNPGLSTAIGIFLPLAIAAHIELARTGEVSWVYYPIGLLTAIGIHVAIMAYARRRIAVLRSAA